MKPGEMTTIRNIAVDAIARHGQTSPCWLAMEAWLKARLEISLEVLQDPSADFEKTQFVRGQIATLNEALDLARQRTNSTLSVIT